MSLKRFYADPYMQVRSFVVSIAVVLVLCACLAVIRPPESYAYEFAWWHLALIPLGVYFGGMSCVFIHNATHNSFPTRVLNQLCGELAGLHQLWGFAGWRLIHKIHHHYSDHDGLDPHSPKGLGFWAFSAKMFVNSSFTISKRYREFWGDTRRTRILQRATLILFPILAVSSLAFWFLLLGPAGFLFFYIPSYIANHLLFVDINYSAHPINPETGDPAPANLNHNLYYKLSNALFCGIYFHGNHHRKPTLFNPRRMPVNAAVRAEAG